MNLRRFHACWVGLALMTTVACASTAQRTTPDASASLGGEANEGFGEALEELPKGARINKKGQVVTKSGKVIGSAKELGITRDPDSGKLVAAAPPQSGKAGGGNAKGAGGNNAAAPQPVACNFAGCNGHQGVTGETIKLGFVVYSDAEALYDSVGASVNFGDQEKQIRALVDDLNRRGGIAGREIDPVIAKIRSTSADPEGDANRACVRLTEDEHVFAFIGVGGRPSFYSCFAQHRTLSISASTTVGDDEILKATFPWYQIPNGKSDTRLWQVLIPELKRLGYFGRDPKVGLVAADFPEYRRVVSNTVMPTLGKVGIKVADTFFARISHLNDFGSIQGQMAQAVLRFKSKGIDHVMFIPSYALPFFFMQNAESQNYRPRYAVESGSVPGQAQTAIPKAQFRGAVGMGWRPQFDVLDNQFPYTAQEKRCFAVMEKGGQDVKSRINPLTALQYCDVFWAFEAGAKAAGRDLTSGSFINGIRGLTTSWPSVLSFLTDFGQGRPDASYGHRVLVFSDKCDCFTYKSGVIRDGV